MSKKNKSRNYQRHNAKNLGQVPMSHLPAANTSMYVISYPKLYKYSKIQNI